MNETALIIGLLMAMLGMLAIYAIFVPKNGKKFLPDNEEETNDNPILKFVTAVGGDFYAALPATVVKDYDEKRSSDPRLESLIVRSGNPWGLKVEEFKIIQVVSGILGLVVGTVVWFGLSFIMKLPWWLVIFGVAIFCYSLPKIRYTERAKERDMQFKKQLPEALDLLIISLSGGATFAQSIRAVIPNMEDGILKEEFKTIVKNLDTGVLMHDALEQFSQRAPNESIQTFISSVQAAEDGNTSLNETLQARADASRQEFFSLIHDKTAQLESKIWVALSPTLVPAVLLIAIAPSLSSMITTMGG